MQWTDRIGRRVKLRDLHIFLAAAQFGSMARAADRLAVSQPVVSKTIADLEHALGVRLLDRTPQGIELTAYGRAFLTCGAAVFDEMKRGVQAIEYLSDPTVGELHIGASLAVTDELIPETLSLVANRYPQIGCHVTDGNSVILNQLLRERKIDLAVSRTWGSLHGEGLATEHLFDETLYVVAAHGSRWLRRRKIDFAELLEEPWALPESGNAAGKLISEGFGRGGMAAPVPRVVSNSLSMRTRLVESGPFLTLLPGSMLHFGAGRLRVKALPVALPLPSQPFEIITLKDRTPNPIAGLFIEELRAVVRTMLKSRKRQIGFSGGRSPA